MPRTRRAIVRQTDAKLTRSASRRCQTICQEIVDIVEVTAPYDPEADGVHLRDAYYVAAHKTEPGAWTVRCKVPYWVYVEFGTGRGPEQPHLRPAVEAVRARHDD